MRNGKIAKLPTRVQEELNERMEKGESGTTLIEWLNQEPDVKNLMEESFDATVITKQNLSEWRKGGFREWQLRRDFLEARDGMEYLETDLDMPVLTENFMARMGGYYAVLMRGWDGKPDKEFEGRARVLRGMLRDFTLLQKGVKQADSLKEELRQRERERTSIWDGGANGLKDVLDHLRGKQVGKDEGLRDSEPQPEVPEEDRAAEMESTETGEEENCPGGTPSQATGTVTLPGTGEGKSGLVAPRPSESHLAAGLDEGHCSGGTLLREDATARQAPSQATGTVTLPGTGEVKSGLVAPRPSESHLAAGLEEGTRLREEATARQAGEGKSGLVAPRPSESLLAAGLDEGTRLREEATARQAGDGKSGLDDAESRQDRGGTNGEFPQKNTANPARPTRNQTGRF